MLRLFRGPILADLAEAGGAASALGFMAGYLYARIYNWSYEPPEPEDPIWQGENGLGLALSFVLPLVILGHLFTAIGFG